MLSVFFATGTELSTFVFCVTNVFITSILDFRPLHFHAPVKVFFLCPAAINTLTSLNIQKGKGDNSGVKNIDHFGSGALNKSIPCNLRLRLAVMVNNRLINKIQYLID